MICGQSHGEVCTRQSEPYMDWGRARAALINKRWRMGYGTRPNPNLGERMLKKKIARWASSVFSWGKRVVEGDRTIHYA